MNRQQQKPDLIWQRLGRGGLGERNSFRWKPHRALTTASPNCWDSPWKSVTCVVGIYLFRVWEIKSMALHLPGRGPTTKLSP